jgi:hypothetical protein
MTNPSEEFAFLRRFAFGAAMSTRMLRNISPSKIATPLITDDD